MGKHCTTMDKVFFSEIPVHDNINSQPNDGDRLQPPRKTNENSTCIFKGFFFIFGFSVNFIHGLLTSATQDILEGTDHPSSLVVILLNTPYITVALILPYFIQRISPFGFAVSTFVSFEISTGLSAFSRNNLQLFGLVLTSVSTGIAEVGFFSSSVFNEDVAVNIYTFGAGAGLFGGPLFYSAMTSWICISPSTTLAAMLCFPPIVFIFHCYVAKKQGEASGKENNSKRGVVYTLLPAQDTENSDRKNRPSLTYRGRLYVCWKTLPVWIALFLGNFCEILLLQSVATTLAFSNSSFDPGTHYVYYVTAESIGQLAGRSYGAIISSCFKINTTTRHVWIFSGILVVDLFFLIYASWYRFLPNVWIVLSLMLVTGLSEGALFANSFSNVPRGLSPHQVGFSRGLLTVAYGGGILMAGFLGFSTETGLKSRCLQTGTPAKYCIARSMSGWSESSCARH
ncbi:protein BTN1-like [Actinia tenebrosa]|uniref:Battenin n=1 Tax=Actinia tenebrosa TaxID=6105 RepID=A0A6P8IR04_ACTTE|nr:protein BTN1-like [Actinia tenebrosa]